MPENARDAFYELVLFPTKACAQVNELYVTAGKNALYAQQGRASTNDLADRVEALFRADSDLMAYYNDTFADGKWNHFMDQVHIGYTSWQDPPQNNMPPVTRLTLPPAARMGVSVEGSVSVWPDTPFDPVLPKFDVFNQQSHYIDVFNRGQSSFRCTVTASAPWILVRTPRGAITKEQRIWVTVDWRKAPKSSPSGTVTIAQEGGEKVSVRVEVFNPKQVLLNRPGAFVEGNGYVSMEAEHYTNNIPAGQVRWEKVEGYGRTLSAMSIMPGTSPSVTPPQDSPCLEYGMYLFDSGSVNVVAIVAPTLNFVPGRGLRYAVSFDDQPPQIISILSSTYDAQNGNSDWEESVRNASRKIYSAHTLSNAGYHTLKIWMVDPAVVLEKIIVDLGGLKGSYLGPPESYRQNSTIFFETPEPLMGSAVSRAIRPPLQKAK